MGGRILAMDPAFPAPEAVVVDAGRVVAVGGRGLVDAHPTAQVEDLRGRTLLPGFVDAHYHLSIAALHPRWADLSGAADLDDLARLLTEAAQREPEAGWVRGHSWTERAGLRPTRRDLDALELGRPVMVAHYSLHQGVVDSRGLDAIGVGRATPDPEGGRIARDPSGEATGLLVETAWSEAHAASMAPFTDPDRWADHVEARARLLLADGITAVHDAACSPAAEAVYRSLASAGRLAVSVLAMPHAGALFSGVPAARLDGPVTGEGDEALRVGPVKLFADGGAAPAIDAVLAGRRFAAGYRFAHPGPAASAAAARGFRVAVHAMGNVGLAAALEALARAARASPSADFRPRVEHATVASPAQAAEMAALGAVAVLQPGFTALMGPAAERYPFEDASWLPFAHLVAAGVAVAGSSDHPCGPGEPLLTAADGARHRYAVPGKSMPGRGGTGGPVGREPAGPEVGLGYVDWLRAYTAGAAFAGGQEAERGSLTPGKRADLVVLDGELDPARPPRVAQTWSAGELVHDAGGAGPPVPFP